MIVRLIFRQHDVFLAGVVDSLRIHGLKPVALPCIGVEDSGQSGRMSATFC